MMRRWMVIGWLLWSSFAGGVAADLYPFASSTQSQQFHRLLTELRCLVCQNESLADSNAPLALDLKQQIYQQVRQGQSDTAIKAYLVARYGDFVLLKPPLDHRTYWLWFAPLIILLSGMGGLITWIYRRGIQPCRP